MKKKELQEPSYSSWYEAPKGGMQFREKLSIEYQVNKDYNNKNLRILKKVVEENIHPKNIIEILYCVQVRHIINSTFYSWIIGFGGRIQIADNDVHKKQFKDFLMENFINKNNAD